MQPFAYLNPENGVSESFPQVYNGSSRSLSFFGFLTPYVAEAFQPSIVLWLFNPQLLTIWKLYKPQPFLQTLNLHKYRQRLFT